MKKNFFIVIMLLLSIGLQAQTKNLSIMKEYQSEWAKIDEFNKKNLPKSAKEVADKILNQAIADKNTAQAIKALIFRNKYEVVIDSDNNLGIFADLENMLVKTTDEADKSLLHSLIGEIYLKHYQNNRWVVDQRTELADFVPTDIKEWTKNIYFDKVVEHLNRSTQNKNILLQANTASYKSILLKGKDTEKYYPTLYDFLMKRNIELSTSFGISDLNRSLAKKSLTLADLGGSVEDFTKLNLSIGNKFDDLITLSYYQQYLSSLLARDMTQTLIITELSRISYLGNISINTSYKLDAYLNLQKKYANEPASVEIIKSIVDSYTSTGYVFRSDTESEKINKNKIKAYEWCKKGIAQFPKYERIEILKYALDKLEQPNVIITGSEIFHPDRKEKTLKIGYKNINNLKVVITKAVAGDRYEAFKEFEIDLSPKTSYLEEEKDIKLDIDAIGTYKINFLFDKKDNRKSKNENLATIHITRIAAFCRMSAEKAYEFYVVDRLTGKPIKDATISILKNKKAFKTIQTDEMGFATYTSDVDLNSDYSLRESFSYNVSTEGDNPNSRNSFPYQYTFGQTKGTALSETEKEKINIFTDRSIYRPGQTVYFKAIAIYTKEGIDNFPVVNKQYSVKLFDMNTQLISEQNLKTNEFGSVSGQFVLPQGKITGSYYIQVGNYQEYISVEEYKRPTFEVKFDKIDKTYAFGDKITLIGHAENFSGVKLQDANVEYNITKSSFWRWMGNTETIENGKVQTKADGSFEIVFVIPKNDAKSYPYWRNVFSFEVSATVTDVNGETQSGSYNFAVGDVSMILATNINDKLDKKSVDKISITATNLDGQEISAVGTYTIYSQLDNYTIRKEVLTGRFASGDQAELKSKIQKLESGKYLLKLNAKDCKGKDVENESTFVLYSLDDKKPPIETNEWFIEKNTTFDANKTAEIILGVSSKDVIVLYELMKSEKVLSREQIKLSNENKTFAIPYKTEYGNDVSAVFTYIIDEEVHQRVFSIKKSSEVKELKLKFEVFRDKLRPGQQEEWRISVKDSKNNPALAELLASMYDASLDKISPTRIWAFDNIFRSEQNYPTPFSINDNFSSSFYKSYYFPSSGKYPSLLFDRINWFGSSFNNLQTVLYGAAVSRPAKQGVAEDVLYESAVMDLNSTVNQGKMEKSDAGGSSIELNNTAPQIRQNFNETAFFYPQLKTNEKGETIISFTVPESNTSWKFRALAYDKLLNTGTLEAVAVSRKELMVTPNLPRFMRQGDKTSISTKISNLSDNTITGKVEIEFFNPMTDEVIDLRIADRSKTFSVEKDASTSAEWTFEVPADIEMIGCRIIAQSADFSDGEQHLISVLPNRMLVTESMPINVNGIQTKQFTFDKLVNNKSNYRLTFEYTSNPAWYAVQALPTLSNPTNENAVNWFASYYANTLGVSIAKQYPKVSAMVNAWKKQGETKEAITSKLIKNEELKAVLLEETPWVLEAKDENEQMQRLSLLFDLNNANQQTSAATQKLQELQNTDGGWSWIKGFRTSRSITQYILYGYASLIQLNAVEYPSEVRVMQMNAINYIDKQIKDDFDNLKKHNKNWSKITSISTNQLEYLFVRSSYRDIPINQESRAAERFYTSVVETNWTKLNLYEQSLLVILSQRSGNKKLATDILKSLREHATTNDEMGMFWANNRNSVFVSQSATTSHVFLMEAFKETNAPESEMNLMKQWLLKQKQTQIWESSHATMHAIYALLSTGSNWFENEGKVSAKLANKTVEPENKEVGTGYFKQSWTKSEIKNDMGKVEISNSENIPSYGALYWQYYEDLDKISEQKGVLNVDKKLFVETSSDKGKSLSEVTESNSLKVGDKVVVRLTVRADRDMEFVHLKDMRASCFEPLETISGTKWNERTLYYQSTKDASTNFYFDVLPKGTYVFEYPVYVTRTGEYANGITNIQCMYAPEFVSHTNGIKVSVR